MVCKFKCCEDTPFTWFIVSQIQYANSKFIYLDDLSLILYHANKCAIRNKAAAVSGLVNINKQTEFKFVKKQKLS